MTLCELGTRWHTDKVAPGYTAFYHALFGTRRSSVDKVLEIGIGTPESMRHVPDYIVGASLLMWQDYFHRAQVFGVDIDPTVLIRDERITCMAGNQCVPADMLRVASYGPFDLIVDDGDHTAAAQLVAFEILFPFVQPGGFYIIEDAEDWAEISGQLNAQSIPHSVVFCRAGLMNAPGKLVLVPR